MSWISLISGKTAPSMWWVGPQGFRLTVECIQCRVVAGINEGHTRLYWFQFRGNQFPTPFYYTVFVLHVQVKAQWFMHVFLTSQFQIPLWNTLFCWCVVYDFDFVSYSEPKMSESSLSTGRVILLCAWFTSSNHAYNSCSGHVLGCQLAWSHRLTQ